MPAVLRLNPPRITENNWQDQQMMIPQLPLQISPIVRSAKELQFQNKGPSHLAALSLAANIPWQLAPILDSNKMKTKQGE